MSTYLIAESGSTKTDWMLLKANGTKKAIKTTGINPNLQSNKDIETVIEKELLEALGKNAGQLEHIFFYGAGTGNPANKKNLQKVLKRHFDANIDIQTDLMAAARSLCNDTKGVVSILGTGSNCCYFDGKRIAQQSPSLGYVTGDEGSGNHMGKRILQYYAYNTFDAEMKLGFEMLFGKDLHLINQKIYKEPFPNRYLASFCKLLIDNRGHYMVENIIEDSINEFFHFHILKMRHSWKNPLHFTGTIAYEFRDVIKRLCEQYELEMGTIVQAPMQGLVAFHRSQNHT